MSKRKPITRRRVVAAGAGALTATILPGIGRAQGAPVKIGVILYLTGIQSFMGQQTRKGNEFGAKIVKEAGGPPMEFLYGDAESKPENGRVVAERLIRDGCTLLIGTNDSGSTISVAQAAEASKIPFLINIASAPQITEQGFTQIFRNFPPGTALVANAVARIKELGAATGVQPKTAVILHVNDTFGQGIIKGVDVLWERLQVPIKIVDRISYDVRARDLSVEVAKAKSSGADLLMPITRVSDAILMIREMVKQNWSPMGIISPGSPGPYEKAFTDALGKYARRLHVLRSLVQSDEKALARDRASLRERDRRPLRSQRGIRVRGGGDRGGCHQARQLAAAGRHSCRAQGHQYQRSHHHRRPDPVSTKRARIPISAAPCCKTRMANPLSSARRTRPRPRPVFPLVPFDKR